MKISVLGSGTWGWSVARLLRLNGHEVTLWATTEEKAALLASTGRNPKLGDVEMPSGMVYTANLALACSFGEIVIFAVASAYIRATAQRAKPFLHAGQTVITLAKGIEKGTLFTMSRVIADVFAPMSLQVAAVSGPTHAEEVSRDMPTALVCACGNEETARLMVQLFSSPTLRSYPCTDVEGVELCGALKNIIALAAGIARGLHYGDNALAALITRGMAEIKRLGLAMGCSPETFDGLAGVGDLMVTCFSSHSRNMNAGILIGSGLSADEAAERIGMVVEGIHALDAAMELADRYHVELPIASAVYQVIRQGVRPEEAARALMVRGRFLSQY